MLQHNMYIYTDVWILYSILQNYYAIIMIFDIHYIGKVFVYSQIMINNGCVSARNTRKRRFV